MQSLGLGIIVDNLQISLLMKVHLTGSEHALLPVPQRVSSKAELYDYLIYISRASSLVFAFPAWLLENSVFGGNLKPLRAGDAADLGMWICSLVLPSFITMMLITWPCMHIQGVFI